MLDRMNAARNVPTGRAAAELDVSRVTLLRWMHEGKITPASTTAGGHQRWDVAAVRKQLRQLQEREPVTQPQAGPKPIVAAIVISDQGILITQRNDGIPPWGFCTGKIEHGELPYAAAEREVLEETGLAVKAGVTITERVHPKTGTPMTYVACYPTGGTDVRVADADELAAVEWVDLPTAVDRMQAPFTMYEPVRAYLARHERSSAKDDGISAYVAARQAKASRGR